MSDRKDDSGPAFPVPILDPEYSQAHKYGLTKREWYAGMALAGMATDIKGLLPTDSRSSITSMAELAHEIADAMIEASKK